MKKTLKFLFTLLIIVIVITISMLVSKYSSPNSYEVTVVGTQYLRDFKSRHAKVIATLNDGDKLTVIQEYNGWLKVYNNSHIGYIPTVVSQNSNSNLPVEQEEKTYKMALTTDNLNLREKPDLDSSAILTIPKDALVIVHDTSLNEWWNIEYEGKVGYSHSNYLVWFDSNDEAKEPIATFSTTFSTKSSESGRAYNINKAAMMLDGYVVPDNTEFSLLNIIGPVTASAGYKEALEYKVVDGVPETSIGYGGGVCQVSTTLYNTFLIASSKMNLELIERHTHALPVSYVTDGMDATISYSSGKDFRFKNVSGRDLTIRTFVSETGCISIYFTTKDSVLH